MERHHLARVVAVLSRIPGCPSGDAGHVFEMLVCLSPGAQLKSAPKQPYRARYLVRGVEAWSGRLVIESDTWVLHSNDDDDPIRFIEFGTLRPGEYMTLCALDGSTLMFQIVNVDYPPDANGFRDVNLDVG